MIMGAAASSTTPIATTPVVEKSAQDVAAAAPPVADPMDIDSSMPAPESEKAQMEAESKGEESVQVILQSEEFWTDLKGFLAQRLRDEREGERIGEVFRQAWRKG